MQTAYASNQQKYTVFVAMLGAMLYLTATLSCIDQVVLK